MSVARIIDATIDFNADGQLNMDVSGWTTAIVQLVSPTGSVSFNGTSDSGGIQGESDGDASTATNWTGLLGSNISTGQSVTSTSNSSMYRFTQMPRFIQLVGNGVSATKVFLYLKKRRPNRIGALGGDVSGGIGSMAIGSTFIVA